MQADTTGLQQAKDEAGQSQTIKAITGLRGLILEGQLKAGERVFEQALVERLGVSRTPARGAILRVCEEGLIEALPSGGFVVASFSHEDVFDAISIRGELEGMAARLAAERGVPRSLLAKMLRCLDELDVVVEGLIDSNNITEYVRLNDQFHELLLESAQSNMLKKTLQKVTMMPFAAPNCFFTMSYSGPSGNLRVLQVAQEQHRAIYEAIRDGEGSRAQALAIEHSRSAWKFNKALFDEGRAQGTTPSLLQFARGAL